MSLVNSVSQKIHGWSGELRNSSAGRFWFWWMAELRALLPASWRERLVAEARPLQITLAGDDYLLRTDNAHELQLANDSDPELVQQQLLQLLQDADLENPEKVFYLPEREVLQTDVSLPLAAEGRLRQALEFDLDRQTPFRSSDVYFDYRISSRDKVNNLIYLRLFLVPRPLVVQHVQALHQMGIDINRLAIAGAEAADEHSINLLPEAMRAPRANQKARFNRLLAVVVVVLLAVAMLQSVRVRELQVKELEEAITSVSKEARMVSNMRQQIVDASEAASFLAKRETEYPEDIEVIAELTRILNKDTWVQRLIIKDGEIRVQGLSVEAQRLIKDINASLFFAQAAFLGTTQFDSRAKRERFNLSAKLVKMSAREKPVEKTTQSKSSPTAEKSKSASSKSKNDGSKSKAGGNS